MWVFKMRPKVTFISREILYLLFLKRGRLMNYITEELIELNRERQWLWLILKFWQFSKPLVTDKPSILSRIIHFTSLSPNIRHHWEFHSHWESPGTGGHQIWEISFLDISEASFVLLYSLTPCFSNYPIHCTPFIASFVWLLAMNEHISLLVQIQPFSTPRHSLRSAAACAQLRPDPGEMQCMNAAIVNSGFVAVCFCRHVPKFLCGVLWGEFCLLLREGSISDSASYRYIFM